VKEGSFCGNRQRYKSVASTAISIRNLKSKRCKSVLGEVSCLFVGTVKIEGILLWDAVKLRIVQEILKKNIEWRSLHDKFVTVLLFAITVFCFGTFGNIYVNYRIIILSNKAFTYSNFTVSPCIVIH
jgi:hypothetical protein